MCISLVVRTENSQEKLKHRRASKPKLPKIVSKSHSKSKSRKSGRSREKKKIYSKFSVIHNPTYKSRQTLHSNTRTDTRTDKSRNHFVNSYSGNLTFNKKTSKRRKRKQSKHLTYGQYTKVAKTTEKK